MRIAWSRFSLQPVYLHAGNYLVWFVSLLGSRIKAGHLRTRNTGKLCSGKFSFSHFVIPDRESINVQARKLGLPNGWRWRQFRILLCDLLMTSGEIKPQENTTNHKSNILYQSSDSSQNNWTMVEHLFSGKLIQLSSSNKWRS